MNRRTLDTAVPMVYAIIVVILWLTVQGTAAVVVTVAGAMVVGLYYAAIRQNLPPGPSGS
jgi:archaellum biogenesis protein FlaJ (TadC family)